MNFAGCKGTSPGGTWEYARNATVIEGITGAMTTDSEERKHYVLQLHFNPDSEARMLELWRHLDSLAPLSELQAKMSWPHVSLTSSDLGDLELRKDDLKALCAKRKQLRIMASFLGTWGPQNGVLFAGFAHSDELTALHRELVEFAMSCGASLDPFTLPDRFVPHCSLLSGYPPQVIRKALALLPPGVLPMSVSVDAVDLVEYYPVHLLGRFPLGGL